MFQAVIFDLDGTLGDTLPLCIESFRRAVHDLDGRLPGDAEIESHFGPSDLGVLQRLFADRPDLVKPGMEKMLHYYQMLHDEMAPAPFPGVIELLEELKNRGIILAMVTGKCMETALITLEKFGLAKFFPMVEPGSPGKVIKGQCILRIADHYGLAPEDVIYVGDAVSDIIACQQAGVPIISAAWADSAHYEKLVENKPDYIYKNFTHMHDFLLERVTR